MLRRYWILVAVLLVAALALMGFVRSDNTDVVQDNVDIALKLVEDVWNNGNMSVVPELYSSSFVWHPPSDVGALGKRPCACRFGLFEAAGSELAGTHLEVNDIVAQDDMVVVHYKLDASVADPTMRNVASYAGISGPEEQGYHYHGRAITYARKHWNGVFMLRFENGKIAEEWWYWDNDFVH